MQKAKEIMQVMGGQREVGPKITVWAERHVGKLALM